MSSSQQKTLEDFISLQHRNALSHAIRAAVDLGAINALRNGQRTAAQLADELGAHPEALARLMDVVAETELVEKYGEDYALSSIARLIPDRFYDFGDEYWKHLVLHAKTGAPLPVCDEVPVEDIEYIANKTSEEWTLTPTAMVAAQALDIGNSRKKPADSRNWVWLSHLLSDAESLRSGSTDHTSRPSDWNSKGAKNHR